MTKRDTPAAKRGSSNPPKPIEEEADADKTLPMPEHWFKERDQIFGTRS